MERFIVGDAIKMDNWAVVKILINKKSISRDNYINK
jgi:hypothetical protein